LTNPTQSDLVGLILSRGELNLHQQNSELLISATQPYSFYAFFRHGRKFKQVPRVKFAENIVTEIRSIPRIDRSLKEKLFYSTEEYMNFREELIYHSEATWENLVVDFLNDQWDKFMFACGFKKLEIRHYHEADLPLDL